jgi:hypothetical protein
MIAFNENGQVHDSYGFKGTWPTVHGPGLAFHLSRLTGQSYGFSQFGKIEIAP